MANEAKLKSFKKKRANYRGQLTRFENFLTNFVDDYAQLKSRNEQAQKWWYEFDEVQVQIEVLESEENESHKTERAAFEDAYFNVIANANRILEANPANQNAGLSVQNANISSRNALVPSVKVPKIDLPTFSGQFDEFLTFYDSFNVLINDNPALQDVERFYYLRSSLKGEAAQVISCLETTAANYQVAWKLIKDRYDNKRLIIHNHVKALFELSSVSRESYVTLRQLLDNVNKHLRALETLKEPVDTWSTLLIYLISSKLDNNTKREWELYAEPLTYPKMTNFSDFLNKRCNILETINLKKHDNKPPSPFDSKGSKKENKTYSQSYLAMDTCIVCKQGHKITTCDEFLKLSPKSRYYEAKKHKLCTNCLSPQHSNQVCTVTTQCKVCNKRHHLLLHFNSNSAKGQVEQVNQCHTSSVEPVTIHTAHVENQVLLSTAVVLISDKCGKQHKCRILLDSGSQSNFLTRKLADMLKLNKQKVNMPVSGLGQALTNVSHKVHTTISSLHNNFKSELSFLVIDQITHSLPLNFVNLSNISIPSNIDLADPSYNIPSKIDALLGASIFWNLLCIGQIKLPHSQIIAQKTKLGWVLSGPVITNYNHADSNKTLCHLISNIEIQNQLERFWQVEQCEPRQNLSVEQKCCEENFVATHVREIDGRFSVQLPLKNDISKLGDSKQLALKRFFSIEKKLQRNSELRNEYIKFMEEYEALGHMSEVCSDSSTSFLNLLPHHAVLKESSTTTKVRVVFDASAKTESGLSLNEILMTGPTIQQDLFSIILRFRKHQFVITADCVKMYRQINVQADQRNLQAILWRSNPDQPLKTFVLNTVTYGTSCAPFLAVRCLHQLAKENKSTNCYISNIADRDFYVDDLISGADTVDGISQIHKELSEILAQGQFTLRKWRSNQFEVNDGENKMVKFSENKECKTLGLIWNSESDEFQYNLQNICIKEKYVTKRTILSYISRIFDPLGLIGPIVIKAKIMLQQLWTLSLGWDESVPSQIYTSFKMYQGQIESLSNIAIPRKVVVKNSVRIEIHTFCDASESAYGACVYLRCLDQEGTFSMNLLCAKSKVAPLKNVSLPRLELCGALLAARLCQVAVKALDLSIDQYFFWCDSSIALTWILDEPYRWKTFVGNRVAEIQELSNKHDWRHVRSEHNCADIISRGIDPTDLINSDLWWHGPQWCHYDNTKWPSSVPIKISEMPERKTSLRSLVTTKPDLSLFLRFSSFLKLQRVIAYILRLKYNALSQQVRLHGPLSPQELELALKCLLRLAQTQTFFEEIKALNAQKTISRKSVLKNLNPFLDKNQLVRVGGRINHSSFDYDVKHPIILPKNHPLTKLIITYEHRRLLHAGPQALLATIRMRFWPISGRNEVRKILKNCIVCFKVRPVTADTLLGQLPDKRVMPSRPFLNCGVDYAGPFLIKVGLSRSRQIVKSYLCVFICLVTKAIHLELVLDLSTNSFLNAFKRFTSRRGKCATIFSDNGTTFISANNQLNTFITQAVNQNVFSDFFATQNTTWKFIPPRSPHFGGIWESAVKAVKYHLRRVVGNVSLTYEELNTIITQVEACLNSRPLSPLSTDPDDLNALTPGHFLIGCPLVAFPEPDLADIKTGLLSRYQHLTQMMQQFWKRWSRDYITELQARSSKGVPHNSNVIPGTMVLICDDNLPPMQWSLGRVLEVHPGDDDVVRVVTIKTPKGVYKRAVRRICVLPIEN